MSDGEEEKMVNGLSGDELAGEEGDDTVVGETVVGNVVNGIDQSGWSSDEEITPDEEAGAAGGYVLLPSSEDDVIADAEELNEQEEREETPNSPPEETINRILPAPEIQQPTVDMEDSQILAIQQAMSGFTLPSTVTPSWAQNLPEDVWKQELLDGIRNVTRK